MTNTIEPIRNPRRRRPRLRRFRRNESGATIVEFAMVAVCFFPLMGAILEMALLFFTTQVLEEAVSQNARSLLTGRSYQIYDSTPAVNTERFRQNICATAAPLIDCDRLVIDVRAYNSFDAANKGKAAANPVRGSGNELDTGGFGFVQPQPKQIVVVRAVLDYPVIMPNLSNMLVNIGDNRHAIIATTTFRAEPFNPPTS